MRNTHLWQLVLLQLLLSLAFAASPAAQASRPQPSSGQSPAGQSPAGRSRDGQSAGDQSAAATTRLLRFPDVHGDRVVFTHGGDLWLAPRAGGVARRLTSAPGVEVFAKFSPDGNWIAFTGQIDGDEQVYVVPSGGGAPVQLTYYPATGPLPDRWGYDHQVMGWTPDGKAVLFRSLQQTWSPAQGRLFTVSLPAHTAGRGALPVPLPMPTAGAGAFSPAGDGIVFSPLFRDFRTWKRYAGGWAQDLWLFDPKTGAAKNITDDPRTDRDPMWIDDRVWYASDRTGTLNLFSYDPATNQTIQETFSTVWDVRWPSAGGQGESCIVYEKGGELWWFDCKARSEQRIAIEVPGEDLLLRESMITAGDQVRGFALSPGGRRAVLDARGDIVTVPYEHGQPRNLTRSPGAHDRDPVFSPDGSQVVFISDRDGDEQLWRIDHLGRDAPEALTPTFAARLADPVWSPDGARIAFGDKDGVLRVVEVATKAITVVADEPNGQLQDHAWSPCSQHLAFSLTGENELSAIHVWSRADGRLRRVSRPLSNDRSPSWSEDGGRLFFLGLRGFQPRLPDEYEWDFQVARPWGVYAWALRAGLEPWLAPRSDEAVAPAAKGADAGADTAADQGKVAGSGSARAGEPGAAADPAAGPAAGPAGGKAAAAPARAATVIDFDGLADRVEAIPVPFDNWRALRAVPSGLLIVRTPTGYYGRSTDERSVLVRFDRQSRELHDLADDVAGYAVSPDGSKVLLRSGGKLLVGASDAKGKDGQRALDLADVRVPRVPAAEWNQIFHEVWRRYRDFFYVENMHGYDWEALRQRYAPLVAHVRHRSDLNYVLGEMVAELNVGHAYVSGGFVDAPSRVPVALLGCELVFDREAGAYRVQSILRGENDDPAYRSPATAVGVDLREGDYLLAIDGEPLSPQTNPYRLLRGKADRRVELTVNATPVTDGARAVTVDPIRSEGKLRYLRWVQHNRAHVAAVSDGRLGYVHLPDMGSDGIREFIKQYYPQRDKQGLVIDDRGNGGGNVSQMVLNRLQRQLLMCTFGRTTGFSPYPSALFHGHLVCLLDETSASDGDIFPAMFRRAGLGKLIGKRSWGGIIGITNRGPLLDGGTVNVPEFGNTEPGGEWTIEGRGVMPDIEVDNDLPSRLAGLDPQLDTAIQELLRDLEADPRPRPARPEPPVRTGR